MKRFIEGEDRAQVTLLPESLDNFIAEDNSVRVVDAFVEELDLQEMGFEGAAPACTGRPAYHPAVLLKVYIAEWLTPQSLPCLQWVQETDSRSSSGSGVDRVWRPLGKISRVDLGKNPSMHRLLRFISRRRVSRGPSES